MSTDKRNTAAIIPKLGEPGFRVVSEYGYCDACDAERAVGLVMGFFERRRFAPTGALYRDLIDALEGDVWTLDLCAEPDGFVIDAITADGHAHRWKLPREDNERAA